MADLIPQNFDFESQVSRLIDHFSRPDLQALVRIYLGGVQDLENSIFEVILERLIGNAVGVQLDALGRIVAQPRTEADDTRYAALIRGKIAVNLSHGDTEDLIRVLRALLTDGETFEIRDEPPAQVRVTIVDPLTSLDIDLLFRMLDSARAGGVRLLIDYNTGLSAATDKLLLDSTVGTANLGGGLGSTVGATATEGKLGSTAA